jgi:ABC-type multidrug transport system ATPase subunit
LDRIRHAIQIRSVTKRFGERILFEDLTVDVDVGQLLVVTGPSGSGKTTLLRIMAGLISFDGEIEVCGQSVVAGTPCPDLVLIPQQPSLWEHLSALDNIALVRHLLFKESKSEARRKASGYLGILDLMQAADRFPRRLSGGEQQRVGLARGLATERPIFLLDEITANIDRDRKEIVGRVIARLHDQGKTVVLVTHDPVIVKLLQTKPYRLEPDGLHADGIIEEAGEENA